MSILAQALLLFIHLLQWQKNEVNDVTEKVYKVNLALLHTDP